MPGRPANGHGGSVDPLPTLAEALVPYLKRHLQPCAEQREFYSQHDSLLGRRQHLELARSGALASFKVGRLVLVRRDAMHRFIESHATRATPEADTRADILADWDLEAGRSE